MRHHPIPTQPKDSKMPLELTPDDLRSLRKRHFILLAICLLGLGLAIELTRIHLFTHTDPNFHSICGLSDKVNCETVALSPYSVFLGLPVSVWGIIGYCVMGAFHLWGILGRRLNGFWPWGILLGLACVSCLTSITLGYIAVSRIDSVCIFCMSTYVLNALSMVIILVTYRQKRVPWGQFFTDMRDLFTRPLIALPVLVLGCSSFAVPMALMTPYWGAPGWQGLLDLPHGEGPDGHFIGGTTDAPAQIIEFSDYECPHCRKSHRTLRQFVAEHPKEVRFIHRHLPLDQACNPKISRPFHLSACKLSTAAECAGQQGKFWEMNDALFMLQDSTKAQNIDLDDLAVRLALDRAQFAECMKTLPMAVTNDISDGIERQVSGTPTFFLNGEKFLGFIPEERLNAAIRRQP